MNDRLNSAYDVIDQYRQQEEVPEQDPASDQTDTGKSGPDNAGAGEKKGAAIDDNAAGCKTGSTRGDASDARPRTPDKSPGPADGEGGGTEGGDSDSSAKESGGAVSDSGASGAVETDAPDSGGNTGESTGGKVALPGDIAPAQETPGTGGQKEGNTADE